MVQNLTPSRQNIEKFLIAVTQDWPKESEQNDEFEIRCISENRTPVTQRFAPHALGDAIDLAVKMNDLGLNVYMTINPINSASGNSGKAATDAEVKRAHFSFADADDEQGLHGVKELAALIKPDMVVRTGTTPSRRYHSYWRLFEPCHDLVMWRQKQSQIAQQFGTDAAVSNPSRLMRLAGTIAYPSSKKLERGYIPELTILKMAPS